MCIQQFASCPACGFSRAFAWVHCQNYLTKLIISLHYDDTPKPVAEDCVKLKCQIKVVIGELACPNTICYNFLTAPAKREAMAEAAEQRRRKLARLEMMREEKFQTMCQKRLVPQQPRPGNISLLTQAIEAKKEEERRKAQQFAGRGEKHVTYAVAMPSKSAISTRPVVPSKPMVSFSELVRQRRSEMEALAVFSDSEEDDDDKSEDEEEPLEACDNDDALLASLYCDPRFASVHSGCQVI